MTTAKTRSVSIYAVIWTLLLIATILVLTLVLRSISISITSTSIQPASYDALVDYFQKVTTTVMSLITGVLVVSGGLGIVIGFKSYTDIEKSRDQLNILTKGQEDLRIAFEQIEERAKYLESRLTILNYFRDIQDPNPDVRLSGALSLSEMNDVRAVSLLLSLLEDDDVGPVRAQAAFGIGHLLKNGDGGDSRIQVAALRCLTNGTYDPESPVRLECIRSIGKILTQNKSVPRTTTQRLEQIIEYDQIEEVKEAARQAISILFAV